MENIFDYNKQLKDKWQKILTLKQMLQRLSVVPAQIKASNRGKTCLNEICQITYFLYQANKIAKKKQQYNEFNTVIIQSGH